MNMWRTGILPLEGILSLIFEVAHLVMEDIRISWYRYNPQFYPYGFDGKLYAGLTATLYIFVGLKCINTWILLRSRPANMNTHLWTRLALFKLGALLFNTRSGFFRDQRFGDDIGFKTIAALHYGSHYAGRWTWCRLHLKKLNFVLITTMMLVWVLNFIKIFVTGVEQMSKLGGFGDAMAVFRGLLVITGIILVGGSLNAFGIILMNVKILLLTYSTMLSFIFLTITSMTLAHKIVEIDVTHRVVIGFITDSINVNLLILVTDVQAACMLRWVTYITLQRTLPIGDANRGSCFLSKDDIPKQTTQILEELYVQMPWRLSTGDILGEGHFSKVYKVELRGMCSGKAKVLAAKEVQMDDLDTEDYASALVSEIKTLHALGKHENLVEFAGLYHMKPSGGLGILLEFCDNGSLLEHLRIMREEEGLTPESNVFQKCLQWSKGIATGMEYLHSRKVVHGDLATRNILLDRNMVCKISDFGMSFKLYTYDTYKRTEQKVTLTKSTPVLRYDNFLPFGSLPFRWMSPEVLLDYKFSPASDIWAYGVTLWEIFSLGDEPWGKCCFDGKFVRNIRIEGKRLERPKLCSETLYSSILLKCWELEPQARLDATCIVTELENFIHDKDCNELRLIAPIDTFGENKDTYETN